MIVPNFCPSLKKCVFVLLIFSGALIVTLFHIAVNETRLNLENNRSSLNSANTTVSVTITTSNPTIVTSLFNISIKNSFIPLENNTNGRATTPTSIITAKPQLTILNHYVIPTSSTSLNQTVIHLKLRERLGRIVSQPILTSTPKAIVIQPVVEKKSNATKIPLVLIWTKYYSNIDPLSMLEGFDPNSCDHGRICEYTGNRARFGEADAVIFHSGSIAVNDNPVLRQMNRPLGQIWIYNNQESPINMEKHTRAFLTNNLLTFSFNWTMTYLRNSDIYHPYGRIIRKTLNNTANLTANLHMNKTQLAVWPVSHCVTESRREELVHELLNYLPTIKTVGVCGDPTYCVRKSEFDYNPCLSKFETEFKFYFALENSLCKGYVTEKFFNAMKYNMVPVVYSGADLNEVGAPVGSYVDVRDFNSTFALAEYLKYLDQNAAEYAKYFEWKKNHIVDTSRKEAWCKLCEELVKSKDSKEVQWYPDIVEWYDNEWNETRGRTGEKNCKGKSQISRIRYNT